MIMITHTTYIILKREEKKNEKNKQYSLLCQSTDLRLLMFFRQKKQEKREKNGSNVCAEKKHICIHFRIKYTIPRETKDCDIP